MIVETDTKTKFKPVTITITLETANEYRDFKEFIRFTDSIPETLERENAKCDTVKVSEMMSLIYNSI